MAEHYPALIECRYCHEKVIWFRIVAHLEGCPKVPKELRNPEYVMDPEAGCYRKPL